MKNDNTTSFAMGLLCVPGLDGDQIYEFSIKTLANAGYIF